MKTSLLRREALPETPEEQWTISHAVEKHFGTGHEFTEKVRRQTFNSIDHRNGKFNPGFYVGSEASMVIESLKSIAVSPDGLPRHGNVYDFSGPDIDFGLSAADILQNRKAHIFRSVGHPVVQEVIPPLHDPIIEE